VGILRNEERHASHFEAVLSVSALHSNVWYQDRTFFNGIRLGETMKFNTLKIFTNEEILEINRIAALCTLKYQSTQTHSNETKKFLESLCNYIGYFTLKMCKFQSQDCNENLSVGFLAAYSAIETYNKDHSFLNHLKINIEFKVRNSYFNSKIPKSMLKFTSRVSRAHTKSYKKWVQSTEVSELSDNEKIEKYSSIHNLKPEAVKMMHEYISTAVFAPKEEGGINVYSIEKLPQEKQYMLSKVMEYVEDNFTDNQKQILQNYCTEKYSVQEFCLSAGYTPQNYSIHLEKITDRLKKRFSNFL